MNHNCVLTATQVQIIRKESQNGMSQRAIARKHNIGRMTVQNLLNGVTYTDV